jgi:hypothetical protein
MITPREFIRRIAMVSFKTDPINHKFLFELREKEESQIKDKTLILLTDFGIYSTLLRTCEPLFKDFNENLNKLIEVLLIKYKGEIDEMYLNYLSNFK